MPQLTGLRFCSIGNELARIDDLTLPLHDADGRASNTTIWLRNGGGKTVIVGLLLWLICPDKGMPDERRRIEDYVQVQDRSVIVAEWQLDGNEKSRDPGESDRYLTGVFYEWRPNAKRLRRLFFVTRVVANELRLSLKGLPLAVTKDGRQERRTLASFKQEWQALGNAYPHAGINETESLRDWHSFLEQARIDPELFHYQIKMNSYEGGAENLFKFRNDDRFVNFFLEMMTNGRLGNATVQTIEAFRLALRRHSEQLRPEHGLVSSVIEHLEPLRGAIGERRQMYRRVYQIKQTLEHLTQVIEQRRHSLLQEHERTVHRHGGKRDAIVRREVEGTSEQHFCAE